MYSNRSMLKEFGFKYDPGKKSWYTDDSIDQETKESLANHGMAIEGEELATAVDHPEHFEEPRPESARLKAVASVNLVAVEERINFNAAAYLHSRVKNHKPVDKWFIDGKCSVGTFFEGMYPGATTVIQMAQTIGMNGQSIKPVLWMFVCDADGNVLARLKAAEYLGKDKKVES